MLFASGSYHFWKMVLLLCKRIFKMISILCQKRIFSHPAPFC